jgi:hypothetical protein
MTGAGPVFRARRPDRCRPLALKPADFERSKTNGQAKRRATRQQKRGDAWAVRHDTQNSHWMIPQTREYPAGRGQGMSNLNEGAKVSYEEIETGQDIRGKSRSRLNSSLPAWRRRIFRHEVILSPNRLSGLQSPRIGWGWTLSCCG